MAPTLTRPEAEDFLFREARLLDERKFDDWLSLFTPEDAPEETRAQWPGPEIAGNRFVLAAQAGIDLSGYALDVEDGKLVGHLIDP